MVRHSVRTVILNGGFAHGTQYTQPFMSHMMIGMGPAFGANTSGLNQRRHYHPVYMARYTERHFRPSVGGEHPNAYYLRPHL